MDTIFRSKNRSRASASSNTSQRVSGTSDLISSGPYSQIPTNNPLPFAGPSSSSISLVSTRRDGGSPGITVHDVGAPLNNPGLSNDGTASNVFNRSLPPISPRKTQRSGISRQSNLTDPGGTKSPTQDRRRGSAERDMRVGPPGVVQDIMASNGLRYQAPSISLGMGGGRATPLVPEFGGRQDPDNMSIRTVSSVNSAYQDGNISAQIPNRDFGRYPSFSDSRVSLTSRTSRAGPSMYAASVPSLHSGLAGSRLSEEFTFPRPSDLEVEHMFQQLLENRDLDSVHSAVPSISSRSSMSSQTNIAKTTSTLPIETKWQMVESDARARWDMQRDQRRKEEELLKTGKAKRGTAGVVIKNSPEWFLKKVMDGTITTQHLSTLIVSLRTLPLESVHLCVHLTVR